MYLCESIHVYLCTHVLCGTYMCVMSHLLLSGFHAIWCLVSKSQASSLPSHVFFSAPGTDTTACTISPFSSLAWALGEPCLQGRRFHKESHDNPGEEALCQGPWYQEVLTHISLAFPGFSKGASPGCSNLPAGMPTPQACKMRDMRAGRGHFSRNAQQRP